MTTLSHRLFARPEAILVHEAGHALVSIALGHETHLYLADDGGQPWLTISTEDERCSISLGIRPDDASVQTGADALSDHDALVGLAGPLASGLAWMLCAKAGRSHAAASHLRALCGSALSPYGIDRNRLVNYVGLRLGFQPGGVTADGEDFDPGMPVSASALLRTALAARRASANEPTTTEGETGRARSAAPEDLLAAVHRLDFSSHAW